MKQIKVFVSQPMNGKSYDEILETRKLVLDKVKKQLDGYPIEVLDSYFKEELPHPMNYIAKSIDLMAQADLIVFAPKWELHDGCIIEHDCAMKYCQDKRVETYNGMDLSDYKEHLWGQTKQEKQTEDKIDVAEIVNDYLNLLYELGMMEQISNMHDIFREQLFHLAYMISHYKNIGMEQSSIDRCELEKEVVKEAMKTIRKFAQEKNLY